MDIVIFEITTPGHNNGIDPAGQLGIYTSFSRTGGTPFNHFLDPILQNRRNIAGGLDFGHVIDNPQALGQQIDNLIVQGVNLRPVGFQNFHSTLFHRIVVRYISFMTEASKSPAAKTPEKTLSEPPKQPVLPPEHGGPKGPEPTRYGDWVINGKCVDF